MEYERDHSHTHCFDRETGHAEHLRCCICYKEKPVQEKPSIGTAGNDMGYPTAVFSGAPVGEEWEKKYACVFKDHEGFGPCDYCRLIPDTEEWEKEFDEFYALPLGMKAGPQREKAIKSFISKLLKERESDIMKRYGISQDRE